MLIPNLIIVFLYEFIFSSDKEINSMLITSFIEKILGLYLLEYILSRSIKDRSKFTLFLLVLLAGLVFGIY